MPFFILEGFQGQTGTLTDDDSRHAVNALRMRAGDRFEISDGRGKLYLAEVTDSNPKRCGFQLIRQMENDHIECKNLSLAIAPTKNISRYEWFLEKATEIGVGRIIPIITEHSERKHIKPEREKRVIYAAAKQSKKAWLPELEPAVSFTDLVTNQLSAQKYIAWVSDVPKHSLFELIVPGKPCLICIGPEGDFSPGEIQLAKDAGFEPVHLGKSRLRTETAGVIACHTYHLKNQIHVPD